MPIYPPQDESRDDELPIYELKWPAEAGPLVEIPKRVRWVGTKIIDPESKSLRAVEKNTP